MLDLDQYRKFISSKGSSAPSVGFSPVAIPDRMFTHQRKAVEFALDPFNGIGSTGFQALKMGRKYLGVELKPEYAAQAAKFLEEAEMTAGSGFLTEAV